MLMTEFRIGQGKWQKRLSCFPCIFKCLYSWDFPRPQGKVRYTGVGVRGCPSLVKGKWAGVVEAVLGQWWQDMPFLEFDLFLVDSGEKRKGFKLESGIYVLEIQIGEQWCRKLLGEWRLVTLFKGYWGTWPRLWQEDGQKKNQKITTVLAVQPKWYLGVLVLPIGPLKLSISVLSSVIRG